MFPTVAHGDTQAGQVTADSATWTLTYPTNLETSDIILAVLAIHGNSVGTSNWPTGWTKGDLNVSTVNVCTTWAWKRANGTESGNFDVTLSAAEQGSWRIFRVQHASTTLAPQAANNYAITDTPNPTDFSPSWGAAPTLWLATAAISQAANYTDIPDDFTAHEWMTGATGRAGLGTCWQSLLTATMDPTPWTIDVAQGWRTLTIAFAPLTIVLADARARATAPTQDLAPPADTFPTIVPGDAKSGQVTVDSATWTLTYPDNLQPPDPVTVDGDLVLVVMGIDGANVTTTFPTQGFGWTRYDASNGTTHSLTWGFILAVGNEDGQTFQVQLSSAQQGFWFCLRITGAHTGEGVNVAVASTLSQGTSQAVDPPGFDPAQWGFLNTLWLAIASVDGARSLSGNPGQQGWDNYGWLVGGATGASGGFGSIQRALWSLNPPNGLFSWVGGSSPWLAKTVAIQPKVIWKTKPTDAAPSAVAFAPSVVLGSLALTPDPAVARALAPVEPTVVHGSLAVLPAFADASARAVAPTILAPLTLTPTRAEGSALAAVTVEADYTTTPAFASAKGAAVAPSVGLSSITFTSAPGVARALAVSPTTVQGSLTLLPAFARARTLAVTPTVVRSSITTTPAPAASRAQAPNPGVVLGSLGLTPMAAFAHAQAPDPTTHQGSFAVTPGPAAAKSAATPPYILSPVTVAPLMAAARVLAAVTFLSPLTLTPTPAEARPAAIIGQVIAEGTDIVLSASPHIDPSGEPTTTQLTPPGGAFTSGRIQDDENPSDEVDIGPLGYTELEWGLKAKVEGEFEFRVVRDTGEPLDGYTSFAEFEAGAGISVSPAAAIARALAVTPTTVLGSVSAVPVWAEASARATAPSITAPLTLAPARAEASAAALPPAVVAGSLTIAPTAALAGAEAITPTLILGSVAVAPAPAPAGTEAVPPEVVFGSATIVPSPAAARAQAPQPTILFGGVLVAPAFAHAHTAATAPTFVYGSVTVAPTAAVARARIAVGPGIAAPTSVTPTAAAAGTEADLIAIGGGPVIVPDAVASRALAVAPTVERSSVYVTPARAEASAVAVAPSIVAGSVAVLPSPAAAGTAAAVTYVHPFPPECRDAFLVVAPRRTRVLYDAAHPVGHYLVVALSRLRSLTAARVPQARLVVATPRPVRLVEVHTMAKLPSFDDKRSAELDTFGFDLVNLLGTETISGATWAVAVASDSKAADPTPSAMLSGGAVNEGTKTFQKLTGGVNGATYVVTATVTTSGGRTLQPAARLTVRDDDR